MDYLLFKAEMIRAIKNTRPNVWPAQPIDPALPFKWQTRRVMKVQPLDILPMPSGTEWVGLMQRDPERGKVFKCRYGQPGDSLWVKETWQCFNFHSSELMPPKPRPTVCTIGYKATEAERAEKYNDEVFKGPWRPSIFMPRWASRFCLEIKGIRVERVRYISEADAMAEGVSPNHYYCDEGNELDPTPIHRCDPVGKYAELWDKINAQRPSCSWADSPWVWVIEFMRVE